MTSAEPIRPRLITLTETLIIPNITKTNFLIVVSLYIVFKKTRTKTELHGTQFGIPLRNHTLRAPGAKRQSQAYMYGVRSLQKISMCNQMLITY